MKNRDGKNVRVLEHRGNDQEVATNYLMEIKIVQNDNKKRHLVPKP